MASMAQSNKFAFGFLLAFALAICSAAAQAPDYYDYYEPPLQVNTTQVYLAFCTGDDSYQPWRKQADYCSALSSGSFPKSSDLINGNGFFAATGWSTFFSPVVGPSLPGSGQQSYNFQLQDGLPAPELLAAVISGYSKYTVVVAEAFVTPDYELRPVSLWVFYNSQVNSLNYNGGGYGYGDSFSATYDRLSFTAFRTDSKGNTKPYKPSVCFNFENGKQC